MNKIVYPLHNVFFWVQLIALSFSVVGLIFQPNWIFLTGVIVQSIAILSIILNYQEQRRIACERVSRNTEEMLKTIRKMSSINDTTCKFYCGDRLTGFCAVNPYGPCKTCSEYEKK